MAEKNEKQAAPAPAAPAAAPAAASLSLEEKKQKLAELAKDVADAEKAAAVKDHLGRRRYRVGPHGAFWGNRLHAEGSEIELVDEVPSRTWKLLSINGKPVGDAEVAAPAPVKPEGRLSDKAI